MSNILTLTYSNLTLPHLTISGATHVIRRMCHSKNGWCLKEALDEYSSTNFQRIKIQKNVSLSCLIAHAFSPMYSFSSFLSSSVEKKTVWKVFRCDHFSFSFFRGCQIQLQLRRSHRCRKTQLLMTPLWIESCSARMASSPSFCENRFWRTEPFIEDLFLKSYDANRIGYGTVVRRLAFQSSRPGSKPTKVQMV